MKVCKPVSTYCVPSSSSITDNNNNNDRMFPFRFPEHIVVDWTHWPLDCYLHFHHRLTNPEIRSEEQSVVRCLSYGRNENYSVHHGDEDICDFLIINLFVFASGDCWLSFPDGCLSTRRLVFTIQNNVNSIPFNSISNNCNSFDYNNTTHTILKSHIL